MDQTNEADGVRRRFTRLRTALKPKTRDRHKAPVAVPGIAGLPTPASILPSSSINLPASQAPEVTEDREGVNTGSSGIVSDEIVVGSKPPPPVDRTDLSGDREKTEKRYREAMEQLRKSVKLPRKNWEAFDIPDFNNLCDVNNPIPQLQEDIKKTLDAKKEAFNDPSFWSKSKRVTETIFTAITPFAKNVLLVAKEGSNVFPDVKKLFTDRVDCSFKSIADRELARRKEVEKKLDYISRQLGLLEIISRLPDAGVQLDTLINRTVDVFSAAVMYLALHIRHESNRLGVIGSIAKDVVVGDEALTSVDTRLGNAVVEFNSTLAHFSHGVGFRTYEVVQGLRQDFAMAREGPLPASNDAGVGSGLNDKFMVPYQKNPNFTGRGDLLGALRAKLCDVAPMSWNHRVALYGLGGVGKTQLALEYVFSHKDDYERIYWISAVSEATVFAGFQSIAERTQCLPSRVHLSLSDVVKRVLEWLNVQENWLLVIDNLDQIEVIDSYLPEQSPGRHTLITTRYSYCDHIPAEGLKVGELGVEDATKLLLLRSKLGAADETPETEAEAAKIVKELGYLALAIEQAAAYIREAGSRDLFKFLPAYQKDRKHHHSRLSKGNRIYYTGSVSTTWRLSFRQIGKNNKDASKLLRLLSFLNPDGILTDFLKAGKGGLDAERREIVSDDSRFGEALGELERFSLIGRQADSAGGERITIHRLVQTVIKDEMPPELFSTLTETVIELCGSAFPDRDYTEHTTRSLKRRFQHQIVISLSSVHDINSRELGLILVDVGVFLREDGNYQQAIELLEKAFKILDTVQGSNDSVTLNAMRHLGWAYNSRGRWTDALATREKLVQIRRGLNEGEHLETLTDMANLASTYWNLGRWGDAVRIEEEVLSSRIRLLGEDDPETLVSMGNLAITYGVQGRLGDAVKLEEEAMKSSIKVFGEDHPRTLRAISNLASTYATQGRLGDAVKLQEEVLKTRTKLFGKDHPDTLMSMGNIASTYVDQGRLGDAVKLEEEVLKARIRLLGEDHPATLRAMASLGVTGYIINDRLDDSISLLEKSYEGMMKMLGEQHPDTLSALEWMAHTYLKDGRLDESIALYEKALEGRKRVLGEDHPDTLKTKKWVEGLRGRREGRS